MTRETFGKNERIRKKRDFLAAQQRARRFSSRYFTLLIHRNQTGLSRLGITASRKVGNAVKRNRVKRLIREFFRLNKSTFDHSCDLVVIAKKGIPDLSYQEVKGELDGILKSDKRC